jgi:hypothetical protein
MTKRTGHCVLGLVLLMLPSTVSAQDTVTVIRVIRAQALRSRIRLETSGGQVFFGRYLGMTGDTVTLSSPIADGFRRVSADTVRRVWKQDGTRAGEFAIKGMPFGALLGAWFAYDLCRNVAEGPRNCRVDGLHGFGIGALTGSLVGAAVGVLLPHWKVLAP